MNPALFRYILAAAVALAIGGSSYFMGRIHEARVGEANLSAFKRSVEVEASFQKMQADKINQASEKTNEDQRTAYGVSFDKLADRLRAADDAARKLRRAGAGGSRCGVPAVPGDTGPVPPAAADAAPPDDGGSAAEQAPSLETECAVTTHQCVWFEDWVETQIRIHRGLR